MIPDHVLDQVRSSADAVAIIGEYVPLKRMGTSFRGPCPFHNGKDRNFSVQPGRGFNCFVCGEKGDTIAFVQKRLGLEFIDAVRLVAQKAGIQLEETERSAPDPRAPFWEINFAAVEYFTTQLQASQPTIDYLASRKLTLDDVKKFGIGYAPNGDALNDHLTRLGFDQERQIAGGLLSPATDAKPVRPVFRNRLMFPIGDNGGKPVGFGGRAMGDFQPKYLNTAESPVFKKGELLYGFNRAKSAARRNDRILVVEGFLDLVRLVLAGIEEVVAPLGTALTSIQCALITKSTANVFLVYDSDRAGLKATFRSADLLLATGVAPRVVTLPDGADPDSFVRDSGITALEHLIGQSSDVLDSKIDLLTSKGRLKTTAQKRTALDKLTPTIRAAADRALQDLYVARAAEATGIRRSTIEHVIGLQKARFGKPASAEFIEPPRPDIAPALVRPSPPWQTTPRKAAP